MLQNFPLPLLSLLAKLKSGNVNATKAAELLRQKNAISDDVILITDEMYLQKKVQYVGGKNVGADSDGNLYRGIVVFMIQGLKKSRSIVIKAFSEIAVTGNWLAENLADCVRDLSKTGFRVRGIVSDNHAANVSAFNFLLKSYAAHETEFFIDRPQSSCKTYLFYDNVHLLKNVRNNSLNSQKFVFSSFHFSVNNCVVTSEAGYISWRNIKEIFEEDIKLKGNLRKAPKLTYEALHPGHKKQNVNLALAVFYETTIAACRNYFPNRNDVAGFLTLINYWWKIVNNKQRYHPDPLANAITPNDEKINFLSNFADWLDSWLNNGCSSFRFSKQTMSALIWTLRSQASLMKELFMSQGFKYILTVRLQSDPIERRFSQYRQLNGGHFLVSLREVSSSEKILLLRTLLKDNINFWEEDLDETKSKDYTKELKEDLDAMNVAIQESTLISESAEVVPVVSGYIARKMLDKTKCSTCIELLRGNAVENDCYFNELSRGGFTIASKNLNDFVAFAFAVLDTTDSLLQRHRNTPIRNAAQTVLKSHIAETLRLFVISMLNGGFILAQKSLLIYTMTTSKSSPTTK